MLSADSMCRYPFKHQYGEEDVPLFVGKERDICLLSVVIKADLPEAHIKDFHRGIGNPVL